MKASCTCRPASSSAMVAGNASAGEGPGPVRTSVRPQGASGQGCLAFCEIGHEYALLPSRGFRGVRPRCCLAHGVGYDGLAVLRKMTFDRSGLPGLYSFKLVGRDRGAVVATAATTLCYERCILGRWHGSPILAKANFRHLLRRD